MYQTIDTATQPIPKRYGKGRRLNTFSWPHGLQWRIEEKLLLNVAEACLRRKLIACGGSFISENVTLKRWYCLTTSTFLMELHIKKLMPLSDTQAGRQVIEFDLFIVMCTIDQKRGLGMTSIVSHAASKDLWSLAKRMGCRELVTWRYDYSFNQWDNFRLAVTVSGVLEKEEEDCLVCSKTTLLYYPLGCIDGPIVKRLS